MKIKHTILIVSLVLFIAIGVVFYRTFSSLDQIIQAAVEKYGPEITQSKVSLERVSLDLANGKAALHDLYIGNPAGFNTEYFVKLDEVSLTLDLDSITSDPIIVKEVLVQGPAIIYELASGGSNLDKLLKNVQSYTGHEAKQAESENTGPNLVIEDIYINSGEVSVSHALLKGKKLTAGLPDIHLEDIGKDKGGASPGEVVEQVMTKVKSGVTSAAGTLSLDKLPGAVADQLKSARQFAGKGAEKAVKTVKDVGGKVKQGLGKTGEKLKGLFEGSLNKSSRDLSEDAN